MARDPVSRQGVGRVSRDESLPPSDTPVMEVSQPDGDNYTGAGDGTGLADPSMMLGMFTTRGNFESAVGLTSTYGVFVRNPQFNETATIDFQVSDSAATVVVRALAAPYVGGETHQVDVTWATETTEQVVITCTITSDSGADGPFTDVNNFSSSGAPRRIWPAATTANRTAVAPNGSLNIVDPNGTNPAAQTLANIQTAFNNAVTRINGIFAVGGQSLINLLGSPAGVPEDWAGMTVPVVELFRDPADPVLAFMVQSPVNVLWGGAGGQKAVAHTCVGIGINIASLASEPDGGTQSVANLTGIMTHELLHGMGTPGAFFSDTQGRIKSFTITTIGTLNSLFFDETNQYYEDNSGSVNDPNGIGFGVPIISTSGGFPDHWGERQEVRGLHTLNGVANDIMVGFFADDGSTNNITPITRTAFGEQGYDLIGAAEAETTWSTVPRSAPVVANFKVYRPDPDIQRDGKGLYEKYHKFS